MRFVLKRIEVVLGVVFLFQVIVVGLPAVEKKETLLGFFLLFFLEFFSLFSGVLQYKIFLLVFLHSLFFLSSLRFSSSQTVLPSRIFFFLYFWGVCVMNVEWLWSQLSPGLLLLSLLLFLPLIL